MRTLTYAVPTRPRCCAASCGTAALPLGRSSRPHAYRPPAAVRRRLRRHARRRARRPHRPGARRLLRRRRSRIIVTTVADAAPGDGDLRRHGHDRGASSPGPDDGHRPRLGADRTRPRQLIQADLEHGDRHRRRAAHRDSSPSRTRATGSRRSASAMTTLALTWLTQRHDPVGRQPRQGPGQHLHSALEVIRRRGLVVLVAHAAGAAEPCSVIEGRDATSGRGGPWSSGACVFRVRSPSSQQLCDAQGGGPS